MNLLLHLLLPQAMATPGLPHPTCLAACGLDLPIRSRIWPLIISTLPCNSTPQPLPPESPVSTRSWSIHSLCPRALKLRVFLRTISKHTTPLHKKHPALIPCPPLCARGFPDHLFSGPSNSISCRSLVLTQLTHHFLSSFIYVLSLHENGSFRKAGVLSTLLSALSPPHKIVAQTWQRLRPGV